MRDERDDDWKFEHFFKMKRKKKEKNKLFEHFIEITIIKNARCEKYSVWCFLGIKKKEF